MKYVLYNHIGSANHGCEALVRTISEVFGVNNTMLLSESPQEEKEYGVDQLVEVRPALSKKFNMLEFIDSYLKLKLKGDYFPLDILPYKHAIRQIDKKNEILVSIGGDIYCYENYPKYILMHKYARKYAKKTILLGCSIEPDLLLDQALLDDLRSYDLITARESITYEALKNVGLTNTIYCPDTAFTLKSEQTDLPANFIPGKTIGINISPLVLKRSNDSDLLMRNFCRTIDYVLKNTSFAIALIPHVAWKHNDDSEPLLDLYKKYKESERVCILSDLSAPKLKYCISQCKCFIGTRTHATIAAYSSGVPTLAVGYSVKSKGIAKDLFGTDENFVVDYQKVDEDSVVLKAMLWILENETEIKRTLVKKQREYISRIDKLKQEIEKRVL